MKFTLLILLFFFSVGMVSGAMNAGIFIVAFILGIIVTYIAYLEERKQKEQRVQRKERKLKVDQILNQYKKQW